MLGSDIRATRGRKGKNEPVHKDSWKFQDFGLALRHTRDHRLVVPESSFPTTNDASHEFDGRQGCQGDLNPGPSTEVVTGEPFSGQFHPNVCVEYVAQVSLMLSKHALQCLRFEPTDLDAFGLGIQADGCDPAPHSYSRQFR